MESLQRAAGRAALYGHTHPQTLEAVETLTERLNEILEWMGPLTLSAALTGFLWRGQPVTEDRDDRAGIGRKMHIEGVSEITFSPGISTPELRALLDVLRVNLDLPQYEEETLESLLWQAELRSVTFVAVSELMQAEALSGRLDAELALEDSRIVQQLIEMQEGDRQSGRFLKRLLDTDAPTGHGDVADQWALDASLDWEKLSDDEWKVRFIGEAAEDLDAIVAVRDGLMDERSSQLLARTVRVLLRCAVGGRAEIPPELALEHAMGAMRQMYAIADAVGILEVLRDAHGLAESVRAANPAATPMVREFIKHTFSPIRVARMMRFLRPSVPIEAETLRGLIGLLPDSALLGLLEAVAHEEESAGFRDTVATVLALSEERLRKWIQAPDALPMEFAQALVFSLRLTGVPEYRVVRPVLLRHVSPAVREMVVQWYADDLPPDEVRLVTATLVDRSPTVRETAIAVLGVHHPPDATRVIRKTLLGEAFATLDEDRKTDLCIAFGKIAGPAGLSVLSDLLGTPTGLLRGESNAATVDAASMGLAAMGTANAIRALEKGARSLSGVRRTACVTALDLLAQEQGGGTDGH